MVRSVLLGCVFSALSVVSNSAELDQENLKTMRETAKDVCGEFFVGGTLSKVELDADVKLKIARLLGISVSGAGNYIDELYEGLERKDLPKDRAGVRECNLNVFNSMKATFIKGSGSSSEIEKKFNLVNGSPCVEISGQSKECLSGYCLPGPDRIVTGSQQNYCVNSRLNCALPGGDGARYGDTIKFDGWVLTCANPNKFGHSNKWAQFFELP